MSTPADVVRDLSALTEALRALLAGQSARSIASVARKLGAQAQLAEGVDALGRVLGEIRAGAVPLRRAALDADALVALLGCVPAFVSGVGEAVAAGGDSLAAMGLGLGDAAQTARSVAGPLQQVSDVLDMGTDVAEGVAALLAPGEWRRLIAALDQLSAALADLKAPGAPTPPAAPADAGPARTGG